MIAFMLCGIGGNIFSLAVDSKDDFEGTLKAGASGAIYGLLGMVLGYLLINWKGLEMVGETLRCNILCSFLFMLIIVLMFSAGSSSTAPDIDHLGHLGGFLTGIWMSAIGTPLLDGSR
jgi:rhomboid protease GluP